MTALIGVSLAGLLRLGLDPVLGDGLTLLAVAPVLLLAALYLTRSAFIFAGFSSLVMLAFLFQEPRGSFWPDQPARALAELAFGAAIITLIGVVVWLAPGRAAPLRPGEPGANEAPAEVPAAEAPTENELRLRTIADSAPVLIWMSGIDKGCIWFNRRWLEFTGRQLEEELGSGWAEGVHPDDLERCLKTYTEAFDARREFQMEYRLRRADGAYRWLLDHGAPVIASSGNFFGYVGSCVDIDDYISARCQLHDYGKQMEYYALELARSNAAMAEVTYAAAHDLKEPLRGITQYAQMLSRDLEKTLDDDAQDRLEVLARLSRRMYRLLDGLMELGRIGRTRMQLREQSVAELARRAAQRACIRCGLVMDRIDLQIDDDLPTATCDEDLITQALTELIANAICFNDSAHPRVEVGKLSSDEGQARIFFIRDNGIGIDQRHHERIFRLFKRLHPRDRYGAGVGAGLAVARRIVERHGGQLWLQSAPGEGTTVYFTLSAPLLFPGLPAPEAWPEAQTTEV